MRIVRVELGSTIESMIGSALVAIANPAAVDIEVRYFGEDLTKVAIYADNPQYVHLMDVDFEGKSFADIAATLTDLSLETVSRLVFTHDGVTAVVRPGMSSEQLLEELRAITQHMSRT